MDIITACREVGTSRGAPLLCGTTVKTVKRVIVRRESGGVAPARPSREHNYDAVTELVAERVERSRYSRAYDMQPGFVTLVSDGTRLTGAYALGPEAGEWLQQVTLAIRAGTPLDVLLDVIQPFPTFSEAVFQALRALDVQVARIGFTRMATSGS